MTNLPSSKQYVAQQQEWQQYAVSPEYEDFLKSTSSVVIVDSCWRQLTTATERNSGEVALHPLGVLSGMMPWRLIVPAETSGFPLQCMENWPGVLCIHCRSSATLKGRHGQRSWALVHVP